MSAAHEPLELASLANPRVKAWLRLRERRERERTGLTVVDGLREIGRALDAGVAIEEAIVGPTAQASPSGRDLVARLADADVPLTRVATPVEARLSFGDRVEGVLAIVRMRTVALDELSLPEHPLVVVVEGIEKPGNLGAIIRSADGAGVDAVVVADARTDLANPNTIRASLGTIFAIPLAAASSEDVLAWCRRRSIRVVAARVDGAVVHSAADLRGPLAIVLGAEAEGLSHVWHAPDVLAVRLPMRGVADSLNVSVAAAVLLYEARRQRDGQGG